MGFPDGVFTIEVTGYKWMKLCAFPQDSVSSDSKAEIWTSLVQNVGCYTINSRYLKQWQ